MTAGIGEHGVGDGARGLLVEDPGLDVQGLCGDPQTLGDLLEDLGGRLAQPPLDLAEVGVADARRCGRAGAATPGRLRAGCGCSCRCRRRPSSTAFSTTWRSPRRPVWPTRSPAPRLRRLARSASSPPFRPPRRYAVVLAIASTVLAQVTWALPRPRLDLHPWHRSPQGGEDEVFAPHRPSVRPAGGPGSGARRWWRSAACSARWRATAAGCCCRTPPGTFPLGHAADQRGGRLADRRRSSTRCRRAPLLRPFLGTGVLGGFTTFSTYAVDAEQLLAAGSARAGRATWSAPRRRARGHLAGAHGGPAGARGDRRCWVVVGAAVGAPLRYADRPDRPDPARHRLPVGHVHGERRGLVRARGGGRGRGPARGGALVGHGLLRRAHHLLDVRLRDRAARRPAAKRCACSTRSARCWPGWARPGWAWRSGALQGT